MSEHWSVRVDRNGEQLVTIEANYVSGKPEFTADEEQVIADAGRHLLAFIGADREPQPSAPPEGLSARLRDGNESCSKFVRGGSGVAPDFYCARCQATVYEHLQREAADALDVALAREREQTAEIAEARDIIAARQRVRDSFRHRGADDQCQCVYCTRDLEGLVEHAADYEMREFSALRKLDAAQAEIARLTPPPSAGETGETR